MVSLYTEQTEAISKLVELVLKDNPGDPDAILCSIFQLGKDYDSGLTTIKSCIKRGISFPRQVVYVQYC